MFAEELALRWIVYRLPNYKFYRWFKGGLWVNFENGLWVQTRWVDKETGYILNTFDGGTYHTSFKLIKKIEDYT